MKIHFWPHVFLLYFIALSIAAGVWEYADGHWGWAIFWGLAAVWLGYYFITTGVDDDD